MVLVLVRLHLVPFRVVALHRRGAVAGGMPAAWGGGLSSAARLRYPVCLSGERLRKRSIEVQQALPRTAVLASQRLESNRQSYTVVRESTKPNRRASIPSSSRWEIPSKYMIYCILRGSEAIF